MNPPEPSELSSRLGIIRLSERGRMTPFGFIKSVLEVCPWSLSLKSVLSESPQCLCHALSTEANLRTIWRRQNLPSPLLACNQTWWSEPPWSMGCHSRQYPYPIQRSRTKDGVTRELIRGLGILVHPSSPD